MKNISGEMERITKLDIRPQHMFVRTLRILMVTILAGSAATLSMPTMAAPVTTTITSGSSTPVATPTIHQGDTVNIEATLSTTDPNENGEGEPLLILSGGGFSATISTYEQSLPFSFVSPVDGVTLSAFIQGYDGDESATLSVDVNQKKRFTQAQKDALSKAAADLNVYAAGGATAAVICATLPPPVDLCSPFFGGFSGTTWLGSAVLGTLALDPSDPNFMVIALPVIPALPPLQAQPMLSQAAANTYNALISNQEQAIGYGRAMIVSINRAQGAFDAGNTLWETKQLQAAAQYAFQLGTLLNAQPGLRADLSAALQSGGFPTLQVTSSDVLNFETGVSSAGLPLYLTQSLTQLGADSATIDSIRRLAIVQDINAVAGSFPGTLTNPGLNADILAAAQVLMDFAITNGTPLARGQKVMGEGFIAGPTGGKLMFNFEAKLENDRGDPALLKGELELKDRDSGFEIRDSHLSSVVLLGNMAIIDGSYQANDGSSGTFRVLATDNSKQGKGQDTFSITLSGGFHATGVLGGGNIKIKTEDGHDGQ